MAHSNSNSFIRDRKLSFVNSIYFIISGLRKSLSIELSAFSQRYKQLDFKVVSKQAFSKARQNIFYEAFKELYHLSVESFYNDSTDLKK